MDRIEVHNDDMVNHDTVSFIYVLGNISTKNLYSPWTVPFTSVVENTSKRDECLRVA